MKLTLTEKAIKACGIIHPECEPWGQSVAKKMIRTHERTGRELVKIWLKGHRAGRRTSTIHKGSK